jgi:hypothetical protein
MGRDDLSAFMGFQCNVIEYNALYLHFRQSPDQDPSSRAVAYDAGDLKVAEQRRGFCNQGHFHFFSPC